MGFNGNLMRIYGNIMDLSIEGGPRCALLPPLQTTFRKPYNVEDLEWRLKGQVMASGKKSRSRLCDQKRGRRHVGSCLFQSQFPSANKSAKSYRMLQTNFQQSSIGRTIFCASTARSLHLLRCGLHQIRCLWCLVMAGATCVWW